MQMMIHSYNIDILEYINLQISICTQFLIYIEVRYKFF